MTAIDDQAIAGCSLTGITVQPTVTSIGNEAFAWSTNLTEALHRPAFTFPTTWGGLPSRALYHPPGAPTTVSAVAAASSATATWHVPSVSDAIISAYTVTTTTAPVMPETTAPVDATPTAETIAALPLVDRSSIVDTAPGQNVQL